MNLTVEVVDETINVSVSVTDMKVPVYLVNEVGGNLENVSVANVTNDTTPEATDKIFLWRAVKGWFYIQFGNFLHNLFGGRDAADCHPAKAITFDVDPVPDFTAVVKGNTLEAITNKVAGLQDYLIDLTTDVKVNEINITHDKNGNPLAIPFGSILELFIYVPFFVDINDDVITGRVNLRLNGISTTSYTTLNLSGRREIYLAGATYAFQQTKVTLVHAGNVFYSLQNAQNSSLNNQVYSGYTQITLTNITSINLLNLPAIGDFCGAGTKVLLKLL